MRPAYSVILLTTLIGAGQGLFLAIYGAELAALAGLIERPASMFFAAGGLAAAGLALAGLIASFFHLGRPRAAWRAAAMWRTSWLSREVIVLPAFIGGALAYAWSHQAALDLSWLAGALTLAACLALFVCTAMIYMCIKFLQEWASPLTLANFFLLGCASGLTLAAPLAYTFARPLSEPYALLAIAVTLAGLFSRSASLARNARLKPRSTAQSATGLRGRVAQRSQGYTAGSFNTREFFHGASPQKLRAIKWCFLLLAFPVPMLLIAGGLLAGNLWLLTAAFLVQYLGLIAERWFFFAQANHPQNLYYQAIS